MSKRNYRLPTAAEAGDRYVPKPPRDSDGEQVRRSISLERHGHLTPMTVGEAEAALMDDAGAWDQVWRHRHPESAAVYDGVNQIEARVIEDD